MVGAHGRANLLTAWAGNMRNRKEPLAHSPLQRLVSSDQGPPTLPYCLKGLLSPKSPALGTKPLAHGHRKRLNMYTITECPLLSKGVDMTSGEDSPGVVVSILHQTSPCLP